VNLKVSAIIWTFIVLDENCVLTVNVFTKLCKNFYRWSYYESILQFNSNKHM